MRLRAGVPSGRERGRAPCGPARAAPLGAPGAAPPPAAARASVAWATGALAASVLAAGCGGASATTPGGGPVTPPPSPPPATLAAQLEALSRRAIFFDHASVGENVMRGVRGLIAENAGPEPAVVVQNAGPDASAMGPGVWAETNHLYHLNGSPTDKFARFRADVESGVGAKVDIAMMKLCYADFPIGASAQATFDAYRASIDGLRARFPGVRFVHLTVPLETASAGGYANPDREAVSTLVRAAYGPSGLVFDIARLESTRPDGTRELDADGVPALVPAYTDDGGHLNDVGRARVARALVEFLSGIP